MAAVKLIDQPVGRHRQAPSHAGACPTCGHQAG
ncbi:MAG: hypothetical protein JWP02_7, partial [Acidimicrobiales bacterium]|nr:hypothetical protein [Acidimicrobiales bacterium]